VGLDRPLDIPSMYITKAFFITGSSCTESETLPEVPFIVSLGSLVDKSCILGIHLINTASIFCCSESLRGFTKYRNSIGHLQDVILLAWI
jgi:hypothetical protein